MSLAGKNFVSTVAGSETAVLPFVSFVVPVRNEERRLPACLASLAAQDYPRDRFEILVADGRSTDGTRACVVAFAEKQPGLVVRLLDNPRQTVAPGRNVGLAAARGEVIAFVEGHAELDPGFLREVAACFARPEVECLGRFVEQHVEGGTPFQRATGLARKSWLGRNPHSGRFVEQEARWMSPLGVATVYRRGVFEWVGRFEESFTTNEDVEFNYRVEEAGILAWYSPKLRYRLQPRASLRGLLKQMYCYGVGKRRFTRLHPKGHRWVYLAPTALTLSTLAALAAVPYPAAAAVLAAPLAAYLALSLLTARTRPASGPRGGRARPPRHARHRLRIRNGIWNGNGARARRSPRFARAPLGGHPRLR